MEQSVKSEPFFYDEPASLNETSVENARFFKLPQIYAAWSSDMRATLKATDPEMTKEEMQMKMEMAWKSKTAEEIAGIAVKLKSRVIKKAKRSHNGACNINAYILWSNANRKKVTDEHPGLSFNDISKILGNIWKVLSDEEKRPYLDMKSQNKKEQKTMQMQYEHLPNFASESFKEIPLNADNRIRMKRSHDTQQVDAGAQFTSFRDPPQHYWPSTSSDFSTRSSSSIDFEQSADLPEDLVNIEPFNFDTNTYPWEDVCEDLGLELQDLLL